MIESRVIKTSPKDEQYMIDSYQRFGWEVLTLQEVFSQDSHEEADGDKIVSVTKTVNFVKIVFHRDTNMPNYDKIVELEKKFEQVTMPVLKKDSSIFDILKFICNVGSFLSIAVVIIGIIVKLLDAHVFPIAFAEWFGIPKMLCFGCLYAATFGGSRLCGIKIKKNNETAKGIYEAELQLARQQQAVILEEVKQYVK